MDSFAELVAVCRKFQDIRIPVIEGYNNRLLIIDRAIGSFSVPSGVPLGWNRTHIVEGREHRSWILPPPLDFLFDQWQSKHPNEFSSKKLALAQFSVDPKSPAVLDLTFVITTWAQVRSFQEAVETRSHPYLTDSFLKYHFDFANCPVPNISVVHAIIETSDGNLIATQRSQHVQYHPLTWSVSLEEGLKDEDFVTGPNPLQAATMRGIVEELLGEGETRIMEFSTLAIAIEFPILNPAFITFARLNVDGAKLMACWQALSKRSQNPEAVSLRLIPYQLEELAKVFILNGPDRDQANLKMTHLHPTSRYRILMAMIHKYRLEKTVRYLQKHVTDHDLSV